MKLLLHACCGPCSLEPIRLLQERQRFDITIVYANPNITPREEHDRRLAELKSFASSCAIEVLTATDDASAWERSVGVLGDELLRARRASSNGRTGTNALIAAVEQAQSVSELLDDANRAQRCRACYRLRLQEAARIASAGGFDALATTLAVSPYQFTDIIHEELIRAASTAGVEAFFEDWRPYYDNGVRRSREMGMYRQNYCGCRFSVAEGAATRAFIKHQQKRRKELQRAQREGQAAEKQREEDARANERRAYQQKQARKHAVLKALRDKRKQEEESN